MYLNPEKKEKNIELFHTQQDRRHETITNRKSIKTEIVSISAVYQQQYSFLNANSICLCCFGLVIVIVTNKAGTYLHTA